MCPCVLCLLLYEWVCASGSVQLCVCLQLSLSLHACGDTEVCVPVSDRCAKLWLGKECPSVHTLPGTLHLTVSGAQWASAHFRLSGCVCGGGWWGGDVRRILCCPCRFLISRPVTAGTGVTVDQCYLPPTSAFLWVFRVTV